MKFIVAIFVILEVATLCRGNAVEKHIYHPKSLAACGPATPKACTRSGPFCESCTSLVICLKVEDGTYEKVPGETCMAPNKCINDACSPDPDPVCDGVACLEFPCRTVGIFPHPFDCKSFVMCVLDGGKLKSFLTTCDAGWAYDVGTSGCDTPLVNDECADFPIPPCQNVGDSGALIENPSIYYVCEQYSTNNKVLYPVLDRCSHGQVFQDFECRDKGDATTVTPLPSTTVMFVD